jgi:hypothetical protein
VLRLALTQGPRLREVQAKASARMCEVLRRDPTLYQRLTAADFARNETADRISQL